MSQATAIWLGEIILAIVAVYLGIFGLTYAYAGLGALSWSPGLYQMHPLAWGGYIIGGIVLLYIAYISLKSAKRGGKWGWR